ncbi:hypothetical protein LINGRAHAP2_LOCUS32755 [Linum grandiflorum]
MQRKKGKFASSKKLDETHSCDAIQDSRQGVLRDRPKKKHDRAAVAVEQVEGEEANVSRRLRDRSKKKRDRVAVAVEQVEGEEGNVLESEAGCLLGGVGSNVCTKTQP